MYHIKLYDYVPKPEPAESKRIIAAHYYPSWTKGDNGLIHEFDDLRDYPDRTPLMGYYEDKNPEVIDWEIKWALEHGVNCWIYCWYRKKENMGKPVTVNDLRLGRGLHDGFFNARYQNMMKFAIMYEASNRWGGTDRRDMVENLLPFWFENYFKRDNYLVLDGKPVVYIYDNSRQIWDGMSKDEMRGMFEDCQAYAKAQGFDGITFLLQHPYWCKDIFAESAERGYDGCFFYLGNVDRSRRTTSAEALESQCEFACKNIEEHPYNYNATVSCFWDPEPRLYTLPHAGGTPDPKAWSYAKTVPYYMNFKDYRTLLRKVREAADRAPEDSMAHRVIMIDNWNEWDEGHAVLPSYRFGFKYLQAIREELTERNNLPDYRMPTTLGFGPYDEVWGGKDIDLSEHNDKKIDPSEFLFHYKDGKVIDFQ